MHVELADALDGEVNLQKLYPPDEVSFPLPLHIEEAGVFLQSKRKLSLTKN